MKLTTRLLRASIHMQVSRNKSYRFAQLPPLPKYYNQQVYTPADPKQNQVSSEETLFEITTSMPNYDNIVNFELK
ncbi:hypothetical protein SS50377_26977 [Spironucleus salmonicida]|uniref:Uncharacterized protein n=1 Tax=Spironucleus salmonicida TaxID=348837 RepID=A0A9P8LMF9_9EUKA|nr:hypothetical protein SS50377_26977 [Spironucleus salmonicida]